MLPTAAAACARLLGRRSALASARLVVAGRACARARTERRLRALSRPSHVFGRRAQSFAANSYVTVFALKSVRHCATHAANGRARAEQRKWESESEAITAIVAPCELRLMAACTVKFDSNRINCIFNM